MVLIEDELKISSIIISFDNGLHIFHVFSLSRFSFIVLDEVKLFFKDNNDTKCQLEQLPSDQYFCAREIAIII